MEGKVKLIHTKEHFELSIGGKKIPHIIAYEVSSKSNDITKLKFEMELLDKDIEIENYWMPKRSLTRAKTTPAKTLNETLPTVDLTLSFAAL